MGIGLRRGCDLQEGKEILNDVGFGTVGLLGTVVGKGFHDLFADHLVVIAKIDAVAIALTHLSATVETGHLDGLV